MVNNVRVVNVIGNHGIGGAERFLRRISHQVRVKSQVQSWSVLSLGLGNQSVSSISRFFLVKELCCKQDKSESSSIVLIGWMYHSMLACSVIYLWIRLFNQVGNRTRLRLVWCVRGSDLSIQISGWKTFISFLVLAPLSRCLDPLIIANSSNAVIWHSRWFWRSKRWIYIPNGIQI